MADILLGKMGFGTPASGYTNGIIDNVKGSFVTVAITTANVGTNVTCSHNLGVPLLGGSTSTPNVTWLLMRVAASGGPTVDATSTYGICYDGGTVGTDSIQLKFGTSITLAGAETLTFVVFFMPAGG